MKQRALTSAEIAVVLASLVDRRRAAGLTEQAAIQAVALENQVTGNTVRSAITIVDRLRAIEVL